MNISDLYKVFLFHPNISIDTRTLQHDDIFFALRGNTNGNQFAEQAIEQGAAYAIVDDPDYYKNTGKYILVDNTLTILQQLASYHRKQLNIKIIGLTGSNGKTTTKELIAAVLSTKYNVFATQGNLNNHIGVPLSLLSINSTHEIGIIEMGANHRGEINDLCEIASPDIGLITNIGNAHIEGFGSFEGVKKAKSELYQYIKKSNGLVFVNNDNEVLMQLVNDLTIPFKSYGTNNYSDYKGASIPSKLLLELYLFSSANEKVHIKTNLVGSFNFENVLAACAFGKYFDVDDQNVKNAIEHYNPENNRSQFYKTNKNQLILDFYNANPTSMRAAIQHFAQIEEKNKFPIIGDMLELGDICAQEHKNIANLLEKEFEQAILVGKYFKQTIDQFKYNNIQVFNNADDLAGFIKDNPINNAFILLKGSRAIGLERIIPLL